VRVIHHQLRRKLNLWQYYSIISPQLSSYTPPLAGESTPSSAVKKNWSYSIISHQLNSYTPPLTGKRNPPSAEIKNWSCGSITPSSAISSTHTPRPSQVRGIHHQLKRELEMW
jgi:hypothetical protein